MLYINRARESTKRMVLVSLQPKLQSTFRSYLFLRVDYINIQVNRVIGEGFPLGAEVFGAPCDK